ncbi:MAG: tryptophan-rich sensory protein, partial [Clostridia bacterium]|nr:tryptophan-rich sensory protein [Clostridia bacterium]
VSRLFSGAGSAFYKSLEQPPLAPPGWIFPVAWTLLYALMGAASYRIYNSEAENRNGALALYLIQLAVNFFWPILFFRFEAVGAAMAVLILLVVLLVLTVIQFWRTDKCAALLMLPYLVWTVFALYLNIGVYFLNR